MCPLNTDHGTGAHTNTGHTEKHTQMNANVKEKTQKRVCMLINILKYFISQNHGSIQIIKIPSHTWFMSLHHRTSKNNQLIIIQ